MSEPTRSLRAIVLAAIMLCIVASLVGAKADQDKNASSVLRIASVDTSRLLSEYNYAISSSQDLTKKADELDLRLRTIQQNSLLPEADQKTLADLIVAENTPNGLNATQKGTKDKLVNQSKALLEQLTVLQSKQVGQLTQQDRDQLTDFARRASDTETRYNAAQKDAKDSLQKQQDGVMTKVLKDVHDATAKVAKEKGFSLILRSDVAFYADNDITDAVLGQLNKK